MELVLEEQKDREKRVLDMCTGSGCIAISLALMGRYRHVAALDVSAEALKVAAGTVTGFWADTMADLNCLRAICSALWGTDKDPFDVDCLKPRLYIPSRVIEALLRR